MGANGRRASVAHLLRHTGGVTEFVYCWGKTRYRRWLRWDTVKGRVDRRGLLSKGAERPKLAGFTKRCLLRSVAIYIAEDASIVVQRGGNLLRLGDQTSASLTSGRLFRKLVLQNPGSREMRVRTLTIDEFFVDPTDEDFLAMLQRIAADPASRDLVSDVWDHAAMPATTHPAHDEPPR